MASDTYARILGAVGQALDLVEARGFAARESDAGLSLEFVDARGERGVYDLSLADLVDLMNWSERSDAMPDRVIEHGDEGMLQRLMERLERRELVGAR
jgi:hypothetical protein